MTTDYFQSSERGRVDVCKQCISCTYGVRIKKAENSKYGIAGEKENEVLYSWFGKMRW